MCLSCMGFSADRIDFVRDVIAYIITVALVIGVAFDGDVSVTPTHTYTDP